MFSLPGVLLPPDTTPHPHFNQLSNVILLETPARMTFSKEALPSSLSPFVSLEILLLSYVYILPIFLVSVYPD